jgi:DNA-binding CsgD family transcriptional regulator
VRRARWRVEASEQPRVAYDQLTSIEIAPFAECTRGELLATGEQVHRRTIETRDDLTAQERQIARLASDGLSNVEIGARLFISQRTVAYHLRKGLRSSEGPSANSSPMRWATSCRRVPSE